ncbi:MAG: polysaccharide biosynthesis/export family protein [Candidatus Omnitrophota bacterium]|nr:polysaccharide export protein [Candidatus Omnitrophota bacterium]
MKKILEVVFFLLVALSLNQIAYPDEKPVSSQSGPGGSYKISAGDTLSIQVYEEQDLSGEFEVKEDGTITYPLLGAVKVARLNKSDVENEITRLLAQDYIVNPYVHVSVKTYHQRNVLVLGCVQKPGSYPFPQDKDVTLLEAISLAGGFTGYASIGGTRIVRAGADGKKISMDPKIDNIINGRQKDVTLKPDDLVYIPERLF